MNKKSIKRTKELSEIEDLIKAYEFAKNNPLNEKNLLECHRILSAELLIDSKRGQYRSEKLGVFDDTGLIYLAVEPEYLAKEIKIFWEDISSLNNKNNLSAEAYFYHAALAHLRFAHLHPFMDGNGRLARLLEKWFLAQKLGDKLWHLQSERYYFLNRSRYYQNINLGVNFYELDYSKSLPFLLMLPSALSDKHSDT